MAPKVGPPPEVVKFEGRRDYPIEQKVDDWGLTPEHQEAYVELFRRKLAAAGLYKPEDHDYYMIRRFLRARTYDFDRALFMFSEHMKWRKEHNVDTILQDFYYDERDKLLAAYPQGYHKLDKKGRPVYVQLIGKINVPAINACTTVDRLFKFHVQEYERCVRVIMPIASRMANRKIDQTFGIMDVKGVGLSALTGDVKKMLGLFTKTDQDNYPEMLGHICIINAPYIFRTLWAVVKNMIDVRTQQKIEILGPNYMDALLKHMDKDAIPEFLGGTSKGTLLDDVGPWNDLDLLARIGINKDELARGPLAGPPPPVALDLGENGGAVLEDGAAVQDGGAAGPDSGPGSGGPAALGVAASFGRAASPGFLTPVGSLSEARPGSAASARHAPGAAPTPAALAAAAAAMPSIAESRSRALVDRMKAMEKLLPAQVERLRAQAPSRDTASSRSAPEGSLLNRVEVLEEAVETLLMVNEALLEQVAAQDKAHTDAVAAAEQRAKELEAKIGKGGGGCCTIM